MSDIHLFECVTEWTGAVSGPASDYQTYSRDHRIQFEGRPAIEASSAPAFVGDPNRLNPEEMLTGALSSCQMLTYLAVMARSRIPVVAYTDKATGYMEKGEDGKMWVTRVTLRPQITLQAGASIERATALIDKAHHNCFIANSVKTQVVIEPTFIQVG